MAAEVTLEVAAIAHARELAPLLRPADVLELQAGGWDNPLEALLQGVSVSQVAVAMRFDGTLAALFGVYQVRPPTTVLGGSPLGCIWFLTGTTCDTHPLTLVKAARRLMPGLQRASGCGELRNWVDARYTQALAFATRALGFEVLGLHPYGPRGLDFYLVSRRA